MTEVAQQRGKDSVFKKLFWVNCISIWGGGRKFHRYLTPSTKINFRIIDLNVNSKSKFPEDNLRKKNLHDFGVGRYF